MNSDFICRPNTSRITYEIIEGEVMFVDFETGVYYSINPLGSVIFNWITQDVTIGTIRSAIEHHYPETDSDVIQAVNSVIDALLQEALIDCGNKSSENRNMETMLDVLPDTIVFHPPLLENIPICKNYFHSIPYTKLKRKDGPSSIKTKVNWLHNNHIVQMNGKSPSPLDPSAFFEVP